jgi:hypothetical protein
MILHWEQNLAPGCAAVENHCLHRGKPGGGLATRGSAV